ncbi:MAG: N-acetyltransferase family protein [Thermoplasmata archaeon]
MPARAEPGIPSGRTKVAFTLRGLKWSDYEPLTATYYELYEERDRGESIGISLFHDRPSPEDEVTWFAGLYRRVSSGDTLIVVADVDGQPVGTCTVGPVGPSRASETGHMGTLGILVNRRFRGRGIGEAMMRQCIELSRGQFELVRLSVFADNEGAKRLYARLGFVPCGRYPRGIKRGTRYVDEDLMILDLTASGSFGRPANR